MIPLPSPYLVTDPHPLRRLLAPANWVSIYLPLRDILKPPEGSSSFDRSRFEIRHFDGKDPAAIQATSTNKAEWPGNHGGSAAV
jgi:hypothetical protein